MILVTVGTISQPFPRLIKIILKYYADKKEKVIIQSGSYDIGHIKNNKNIEICSLLEFSQLNQYIKKADTIICAGGEGTLIQILTQAKNKPIIFPRLKKYGEHLNNQQLYIAKLLAKRKLAHLAATTQELKLLLKKQSPEKNNFIRNFKNRSRLTQKLTLATSKFL